MNILHVVAGMPAVGSGVAEVVARLARETVRLGHEATIATVAGRDEAVGFATEEAVQAGASLLRFAASVPKAVAFSWEMLGGFGPVVERADIVHVHSDWTFPVWWGCRSATRHGKPYVMSPHGCLDPVRLAHSAWKKRLVRFLDRRCLRNAAAIHATSDAESGWIRAFLDSSGRHPRIEVIPNGVDVPRLSPKMPSPQKSDDRVRRVLYLGRLHPLKGLDMLLHAWGMLHMARRWELVVAGPDEHGTRSRLEELSHSLDLTSVSFPGPLSGDEKARAIANADLLVLPSRSENFGVVVAEALAAGIPVITTTATPWAEIDGRCGWCVEATVEQLALALVKAMQLTDAELASKGAHGRELVEAKYRWPAVAATMLALYSELIAFRSPDRL